MSAHEERPGQRAGRSDDADDSASSSGGGGASGAGDASGAASRGLGDAPGGGTGDGLPDGGEGGGADAGPSDDDEAFARSADELDTDGEGGTEGEEGERDEEPVIDELFRFSHTHRVRYDEVDAQGVVGNATWLNLIQLGRIEYLREIGMQLEGGTGAPVQAVVRRSVVDYLAPARFDDALLLRVRCSYLGNSSARFDYIIDQVESGLRCVVAETVMVCLDMARFRSTPWPALWRERIADYEQDNVQIGQG